MHQVAEDVAILEAEEGGTYVKREGYNGKKCQRQLERSG